MSPFILSGLIVLGYIFLGGLTSAIYNEVLQFFLIVAGFAPLVWIGLRNVGGWQGIKQTLPATMTHSWRGLAHASTNTLGVEWVGLAMGLGFVLSFGYWCTGFSGDPARHGRRLRSLRPTRPAYCRYPEDVLSISGHPAWPHRRLSHQPHGRADRQRLLPAAAQFPLTSSIRTASFPSRQTRSNGSAVLDSNGNPVYNYDPGHPGHAAALLSHRYPWSGTNRAAR